jgi:hypothetical protein
MAKKSSRSSKDAKKNDLLSERAKLKKRKKELEHKYLETGKIDKLMVDKEYQKCEQRIEEIDKELTVEKHVDDMDKEIKDFRKRLKQEVERMLKKK